MSKYSTIAVIYGCDSSEWVISCRSGEFTASRIDGSKYDVYEIFARFGHWSLVARRKKNSVREIFPEGERPEIDKTDFSVCIGGQKIKFDYAYITIHGTPGENGLMQGYFELIGVPYSTSGVLVEAMTFDKYVLNRYLSGYGINVARSLLLRRGEENKYSEEEIERIIGMPCFVKPAADGSSFGVSKVKNADQLAPALRVAFMESNEVMIESFLDGTEISIGCYKTKDKSVVFPATEVVTANEFFDYNAKYNGEVQEITPARISPDTAARVAEETSRIYDILRCNGIIRVDYIITKDEHGNDKINMLEVNTTPGMTATSFIPQQVRAAGLDIKDVLTDIVENQF